MPDYLYEEIRRGALLNIQEHLSFFWVQAYNNSKNEIKDLVRQSLLESDEYNIMLLESRVYHEVGIPDIDTRMEVIIDYIVNDIEFSSTLGPVINDAIFINAFFEIRVLNNDYSQLTNLPQAEYLTAKGFNLEWLRWLLYEGTTPVILNFHYLEKQAKASRTEEGLMVPKGHWSVPVSIAGVQGNNWLTRAVDKIRNKVPIIIENNFQLLLD